MVLRLQIDAMIVRIMKSRKRMQHTALMAELLQQLSLLGFSAKVRFAGIATRGAREQLLWCAQCVHHNCFVDLVGSIWLIYCVVRLIDWFD